MCLQEGFVPGAKLFQKYTVHHFGVGFAIVVTILFLHWIPDLERTILSRDLIASGQPQTMMSFDQRKAYAPQEEKFVSFF